MSESRADVTELLHSWSNGNPEALDQIVFLVVDELRRTARQLIRKERANLTLQPTALVNELWLRLASGNSHIDWKDRSHFFGICARVMRQTLVDSGRRRSTEKRGAGFRFLPAEDLDPSGANPAPDLLVFEQLLDKLSRNDPRKAKIFEMRVWGGYEIAEIAEALNISESSVTRDWRFTKSFIRKCLFSHIEGSRNNNPNSATT